MTAINDMLMVNTKATAPLNANAPADSGSLQVSNFVTVQSLGTFAVAVPVLKTIWELIKALHKGGWTQSFWTPLVICLVYALWQFAISVSAVSSLKGRAALMGLVSTAVVAVANAAILAAAVIGLTETTT